MGDIVTLLIRLLSVVFPLIAAIGVPFLFARFDFMKKMKNKALKIFVLIIVGILAGIIAIPLVAITLASITTFEQSSGMCFGISCPIGS